MHQLAPVLSNMICYHYDQAGHMKASCPLIAVGPVQTPTMTTLRIIDERQGRFEASKARDHAFQLTSEEAKMVLDVVCNTLSSEEQSFGCLV